MIFGLLMLQSGVAAMASCGTSESGFNIVGVQWGNSTYHVSAGPGMQDVPFTITLASYSSSCTLVDVKGQLQVQNTGLSNYNGTNYANYFIQSVTPGQIVNMVYDLNIANSTKASQGDVILVNLVVSAQGVNGSSSTSQTLGVQVPMYGEPNVGFKSMNPSLVAGGLNNVTINVTNSGTGMVSGLATTVSSSASLSIVSQPAAINSLLPGQSAAESFEVYVGPSLAGQPVNFNLDSHYISPYGYNTTQSGMLGMYALTSSSSQLILSASNQTIVSGKVNNMTLVVTNDGNAEIGNVTVLLSPQSPLSLIGSDGLFSVGSLKPGGSAKIPMQIYAGASASVVTSIDVTLDFNGQSSARTLSFLTPGYTGITTLNTVIVPSVLTRGQIFSLTSTLQNSGSTTAAAATVTPQPPAGITVVGENTTFIGSIPTDTPTAFTMSFLLSQYAKPGEYTIPVVLSYLNNLNQRQNQTFYYSLNVPLPTNNTNSTQSGGIGSRRPTLIGLPTLLGFVILVVAAGVIVWYKKFRHPKQTKKVR